MVAERVTEMANMHKKPPTGRSLSSFAARPCKSDLAIRPQIWASAWEFVVSLNEVSEIRNSYNLPCLLIHIDELQLTILPSRRQIDTHKSAETKTI